MSIEINPARCGELTTRQQEVLDFIADHVRYIGYPPTAREIADALGLASPHSATRFLRALEKKGFIEREPNRSRAIRLVNRGTNCPLCGRETIE